MGVIWCKLHFSKKICNKNDSPCVCVVCFTVCSLLKPFGSQVKHTTQTQFESFLFLFFWYKKCTLDCFLFICILCVTKFKFQRLPYRVWDACVGTSTKCLCTKSDVHLIEANKRSKERPGPTLGVYFTYNRCPSIKRELTVLCGVISLLMRH